MNKAYEKQEWYLSRIVFFNNESNELSREIFMIKNWIETHKNTAKNLQTPIDHEMISTKKKEKDNLIFQQGIVEMIIDRTLNILRQPQ